MKIEERTKKDRETELTESVDKEIHEHCGELVAAEEIIMITSIRIPTMSMGKLVAVKEIIMITSIHIPTMSMGKLVAVKDITTHIPTRTRRMRITKKSLFHHIERVEYRRICLIILDERTVLPRWKQGYRRCLR